MSKRYKRCARSECVSMSSIRFTSVRECRRDNICSSKPNPLTPVEQNRRSTGLNWLHVCTEEQRTKTRWSVKYPKKQPDVSCSSPELAQTSPPMVKVNCRIAARSYVASFVFFLFHSGVQASTACFVLSCPVSVPYRVTVKLLRSLKATFVFGSFARIVDALSDYIGLMCAH